ncbi:hypothetical protein BV25DRAFT_1840263 [Artomyces pyxidatus]|uniref:Uncharacterized protein n=1 Tax=Artomyces pyxidatus TaxID=48021 RepID=A0ACB8ST20_9AGAM|nr:hypothetical protein BV25DRAFT_1840263 [Artomyces pyxidatus]
MSLDFSASELANPLVVSLNTLLLSLGLPFTLETPLDLTPSLLLAVVESLLKSRLPISQSIRESRSDAAKVQAMKIFLGVLEADVVGRDVGLSDIDPRRLAAGEWEETVFVAELLCWLGKQMGLLLADDGSISQPPERVARGHGDGSAHADGDRNLPRMLSPSTRSTVTNSMASALSIDGEGGKDTDTTVHSVASDIADTPRASLAYDHEHRHLPRCIHEIEDPSFLAPEHDSDDADCVGADDASESFFASEPSYCECAEVELESVQPTIRRSGNSVRYDGYIEEVDADVELQAFEARRVVESYTRGSPARKVQIGAEDKVGTPHPPGPKRMLTRHTSPGQHALALLNERARLLSELAQLNLTSR